MRRRSNIMCQYKKETHDSIALFTLRFLIRFLYSTRATYLKLFLLNVLITEFGMFAYLRILNFNFSIVISILVYAI